jgi:hypothetical protein
MSQSLGDALIREKIEQLDLFNQFFTKPITLLESINLESIDSVKALIE